MKKLTVRVKNPEEQQPLPASEPADRPVPAVGRAEKPFLMSVTDIYRVEKAVKGVVRYGSVNIGDAVAIVDENCQFRRANVRKVHSGSGTTSVWLDTDFPGESKLLCKPVLTSAADAAKLLETERAEHRKSQKFYMRVGPTTVVGDEPGVNGTILRGEVRVGDAVELIGTDSELPRRAVVTAIEIANGRTLSDIAQEGDEIRIALSGVPKSSLQAGSVLYAPDSLTIFGGYISLDDDSEGLYKNYRPKAFSFDGQPVGGVVTMITTSERLGRSDNDDEEERSYFDTDDYEDDEDEFDEFDEFDDDGIPVIVALDRKINICEGDYFTVRDHGEIGEGCVVKVID